MACQFANVRLLSQNASTVWQTDDPDFSPCFERTALVWAPCVLLWLLSPVEVYLLRRSRGLPNPWTVLNISKCVSVQVGYGLWSNSQEVLLNINQSCPTDLYFFEPCCDVTLTEKRFKLFAPVGDQSEPTRIGWNPSEPFRTAVGHIAR